MTYELLRQYTGNGLGISMGSLRDALHRAEDEVMALDPAGVLGYGRRKTLAAAVVMARFRVEYSHLETRIKAGDGAEEILYFDVEDRQNDRTPMAELINLTGGRTILQEVERVEMLGAEVFVREVIAGRY